MVKNLQCLKTPQIEICYLTHAKHYAKNRTFLHGLDHDIPFLNDPLFPVMKHVIMRSCISDEGKPYTM